MPYQYASATVVRRQLVGTTATRKFFELDDGTSYAVPTECYAQPGDRVRVRFMPCDQFAYLAND